jgi:hypothetical protein
MHMSDFAYGFLVGMGCSTVWLLCSVFLLSLCKMARDE